MAIKQSTTFNLFTSIAADFEELTPIYSDEDDSLLRWERLENGLADGLNVLFSAKDTCSSEGIIFPILINSRHWLEIKLKRVLKRLRISVDPSMQIPHTHSLKVLWMGIHKWALPFIEQRSRELEEIFENPTPEIDEKDIAFVTSAIDAFGIDSTGQVFRYPEDKNGRWNLFDVKSVDVQDLYDEWRHLKLILDQIQEWADTRVFPK